MEDIKKMIDNHLEKMEDPDFSDRSKENSFSKKSIKQLFEIDDLMIITKVIDDRFSLEISNAQEPEYGINLFDSLDEEDDYWGFEEDLNKAIEFFVNYEIKEDQ